MSYRCICLNKDNTKYESSVPKAECDLLMYLKDKVQYNIKSNEFDKLIDLIEEYGSEMYDKRDS
jgi:hypothetical protein